MSERLRGDLHIMVTGESGPGKREFESNIKKYTYENCLYCSFHAYRLSVRVLTDHPDTPRMCERCSIQLQVYQNGRKTRHEGCP